MLYFICWTDKVLALLNIQIRNVDISIFSANSPRIPNAAPAARNVSRHGRKETATLANPLYTHTETGIENSMVPLQIFQRSKVLNFFYIAKKDDAIQVLLE
jgi:hypothetical protein